MGIIILAIILFVFLGIYFKESNKIVLSASVFSLIITVFTLLVLPIIAQQKRKRRFICRPVCDIDLFIRGNYDAMRYDSGIVLDILMCLSKDIDVDPSQIYPTDSFEEGVLFLKWWGRSTNDFVNTEEYLDKILRNKLQDENIDLFLEYFMNRNGDMKPLTVVELVKAIEEKIEAGSHEGKAGGRK